MVVEKKSQHGKKGHRKPNIDVKALVLKNFNRCAKAIKTGMILKVTKKLQAAENDDAKEKLLLKLQECKKIDHQFAGKAISRHHFASAFADETGGEEPAESFKELAAFLSHKKTEECLSELQKRLKPRHNEKSDKPKQLRSRANKDDGNESQAGSRAALSSNSLSKNGKNKLTHAGKIAKRKAVFMDSLDGSGSGDVEDEPLETDNYERVRIEKAQRNMRNRAANRKKREQEIQQQMNIYRPADQRDESLQRKPRDSAPREFKPRPRPAQNMERPAAPRSFSKPIDVIPTAVAEPSRNDLVTLAQNGRGWKETGVHPSWAAKKAVQTPTIVASQGTKITFDD